MTVPLPPFSLEKSSRYDQSTYVGRLYHFMQIMNPGTLLTTQKELDASLALLDLFKNGSLPKNVTDKQLWDAKTMRDSMVHPDTGKVIFWPCRMAAFTPVNVPIVAGMLYSAPTVVNTIFWQWMNQSVNVAVNYANRNASNEMSTQQIATAYGAAVGVSCGIALGLGEIAKRSKSVILPKMIPFLSVAAAGAFNVVLMRRNEAETGISVVDENGTNHGLSKAAGVLALKQVALTRTVLPAPVLLLPPLLVKVAELSVSKESFLK